MELQKWIDKGSQIIIEYAPKIVLALVIWIVGAFVIKYLRKGISKTMDKSNYDLGLKKFLLNLIGWALKIILIVIVLSTVGVETTSLAAVMAAAGLAIGLALQGSLANFAGGVLIMIFKPFKIGDFIKAQGENGTVKEIEIFTTKLTTPDNKEVIIPNGSLSNGNITNFSTEPTRRVDITFGVGYDSDIKTTKEVIMSVIKANELILKDPEPAINVATLGDSSINFFTRVWVNKDDYWAINFYMIEQTKEALDAAGIDIPYPHSVEIQKQG